MIAWVFDQVLMQCWPMLMLPPEVLLQALRQPAQSASVLTMTFGCGACIGYLHTSLECALRYRPILANRLN